MLTISINNKTQMLFILSINIHINSILSKACIFNKILLINKPSKNLSYIIYFNSSKKKHYSNKYIK